MTPRVGRSMVEAFIQGRCSASRTSSPHQGWDRRCPCRLPRSPTHRGRFRSGRPALPLVMSAGSGIQPGSRRAPEHGQCWHALPGTRSETTRNLRQMSEEQMARHHLQHTCLDILAFAAAMLAGGIAYRRGVSNRGVKCGPRVSSGRCHAAAVEHLARACRDHRDGRAGAVGAPAGS